MKRSIFAAVLCCALIRAAGADPVPKGNGGAVALEPMDIAAGWQLQDAANVTPGGNEISLPGYHPVGWRPATVPGTVLTSLVKDGIYPEPLYGENNRPDKIPESLARAVYWYRTTFKVPANYRGEKSG
jgi:hypothetical protein